MRTNKKHRRQNDPGGGGWPQAQGQGQPQGQQQPAPTFQVPPVQVVNEPQRSYAAPPPPPPAGQQPPAQGAQQQPPIGPRPLGIDDVFPNDPNLPPEIRGRPVRDALDAYNTMRQDFLRRNGVPAPQAAPQAPSQQHPQPTQGAPAARPVGQPPAGVSALDAAISSAVERAMGGVMAQLQPVLQASHQSGVERALTQVRGEYQDFGQYEGSIRAQLQNAPPEILSNPETYRAAYKYAIGEAALAARQRGGQPPAQPRWVPAGGQQGHQPPPAQQFFTESPTPNAGQLNANGFTPMVLQMAQKFGMTPEEYVQWGGGNVPPQGGQANAR